MQKTEEGQRLTNFSPGQTSRIGEVELTFTYKRDDLNVSNQLQSLKYFTPFSYQYTKLYLTNSAQIAISITLYYLKNVAKLNVITSLDPLYRGTVEACELLGVGRSKDPSKVLWICSSDFSQKHLAQYLDQRWDYLVVDTTCWALDETILHRILTQIKCRFLIQIRSISKLDMGGVEYGSLGSLIISSQEKIETKDFDRPYRLFGAAPSLCDIPVSLSSPEAFEKNLKRCKRIIENSNLIKKHLKWSSFVDIHFPEHGKYFYLTFKMKDIKVTQEQWAYLSKLFIYFQLDVKYLKSFGFNFWNLDKYIEDETQFDILRICVSPTEDNHEVKKMIFSLNKFIKKVENENKL